ncbi:non-heme ferritin [Sulfurimonas sp.]|uniref:non-heme ferritin n=1 Tax=Sulfurimonas sp. TaxID=2022749 RepID=UPI003D0ED5FC
MLSKNLLKKLNEQVTLEFYSSNLYLQMSSWCNHKGLEGSAKFLRDHANDEMSHMQKIFSYVQDTGALAIIDTIEKPIIAFENLLEVFVQTYEHEKMITSKINELVDIALSEKDFSTFNFLQWYVAEQHEEEKLFKSILDKIEVIGLDGRGLFMIDREIGNITIH